MAEIARVEERGRERERGKGGEGEREGLLIGIHSCVQGRVRCMQINGRGLGRRCGLHKLSIV